MYGALRCGCVQLGQGARLPDQTAHVVFLVLLVVGLPGAVAGQIIVPGLAEEAPLLLGSRPGVVIVAGYFGQGVGSGEGRGGRGPQT